MLTLSEPVIYLWKQGTLTGVTFEFPQVGSGLPIHSHPDGQAHFTFVRKGRLKILRPPGIPETIVEAGAWIRFDPGEEHGYYALEPSKITNIIY